jgi:hypothetical protein
MTAAVTHQPNNPVSPDRRHHRRRARAPAIFPAVHSRVVIRLAQIIQAKPNANTRTLRPDKCLVVPSLAPGLRPGRPRNTRANAVTTRELKAGENRRILGFPSCFPLSRTAKNQAVPSLTLSRRQGRQSNFSPCLLAGQVSTHAQEPPCNQGTNC